MLGLIALGLAVWAYDLLAVGAYAHDAHAYFVARSDDLYAHSTVGTTDAYLYSPAFAQLIEPLRQLGWGGFQDVWWAGQVAALTVLTGPFVGLFAFLPSTAFDIKLGNIDVLLALAVAGGFRYPATWSFVLLTKVTPGIGLLWFAVRREWRSLGIALGATLAIALVSFVAAPAAWQAWFGALTQASGAQIATAGLVPLPLAVRLVAAALITVWGARTDRRWAVVVAVFFALPVLWTASATVLVGALPLLPRPLSWRIQAASVDNTSGAVAAV